MTQDEAPQAATLDWDECIALAGGNAALARDLIGMLRAELPGQREKIRHAFSRSDWQNLWDEVHRLHGSTAYCGVPALRHTAAALEVAIKARDTAAVGEHLVDLDAATRRLLDVTLPESDD